MAKRKRTVEGLVMLEFFRGKRVLVTGHTGFEGSWLSMLLLYAGAEVTGYALEAPTEPNMFGLLKLSKDIRCIRGDVRNLEALSAAFAQAKPEIVIHMAAQPLVREGYRDPAGTYATNVMGTVNLMECVRHCDPVRSVLNVTTDKVYHNREWVWGYREIDELDGFDPYSNSKSCAELVTGCYRNSFWQERELAVSTARAGNVIGGGDFANDRIVPDCVRAVMATQSIQVRNLNSVRPYQHVLEPLYAYLLLVQRQWQDIRLAGSYNIGPEEWDCVPTGRLADLFVQAWGEPAAWEDGSESGAVHEASYLKLDCTKMKSTFDWKPRWNIQEGMQRTVDWYKAYQSGGDLRAKTLAQIEAFLNETAAGGNG